MDDVEAAKARTVKRMVAEALADCDNARIEQTHRDDLARTLKATPKQGKLSTFEAVKKVNDDWQCARVGGQLVDGTTASVIVQVHAALNDENKKKFEALPIKKMAAVAWKLAKGKG
jgi:hypothetical protein